MGKTSRAKRRSKPKQRPNGTNTVNALGQFWLAVVRIGLKRVMESNPELRRLFESDALSELQLQTVGEFDVGLAYEKLELALGNKLPPSVPRVMTVIRSGGDICDLLGVVAVAPVDQVESILDVLQQPIADGQPFSLSAVMRRLNSPLACLCRDFEKIRPKRGRPEGSTDKEVGDKRKRVAAALKAYKKEFPDVDRPLSRYVHPWAIGTGNLPKDFSLDDFKQYRCN